MNGVDIAFWRGRRVLLTGHTGFKGAWAGLWLSRMGAEVTGLALPPDTDPSLYNLAGAERDVASAVVDLRDRVATAEAVRKSAPEIVLHMAAQPLVRRAHREPVETIATNVMGTTHLLDALRDTKGIKAILVVTTDKVYHGGAEQRSFREVDRLGGHEPYSASKSAAEIVTRALGDSYFEPNGVAVATARGGNVLGGGDFAEDRLVPDIVRATLHDTDVILRHPDATRPWQHVLDCVGGYLCYLQALASGRVVPRSLNFGPSSTVAVTVAQVTDAILSALETKHSWRKASGTGIRETPFLSLDTALARRTLGWRDLYTGAAIVELTAAWYREFRRGADMRAMTLAQVDSHMRTQNIHAVGTAAGRA